MSWSLIFLVLSLHPHWCHESARDEKRMQEAIEVDSECIARLHYVNFLSGRLSFPLLSAVAMGHVRCSRLLAEAEVASERRDTTGNIFTTKLTNKILI
jgi:hypothetical protein